MTVDPAIFGTALIDQVATVLLGKRASVTLAVSALFAGGHVLVEDLPGVGKTSLAKALAASIGGSAGRIQGTADLMASDITGFSIFNPASGDWVFRRGPIFNDVVLFDEINRATPRAQSALLEAMAERQVTVDGEVRPLAPQLFVIATQNPQTDAGTFPLSAGQRDRFALVLSLGLPDRDVERDVVAGIGGLDAVDALRPVFAPADLRAIVAEVKATHVAGPLVDYVVDVAIATRRHPDIATGLSPRGSQVLLAVAKAYARLGGRTFVLPDDVKAVAVPVIAHRLEFRAARAGFTSVAHAAAVTVDILASVPVPVP